MDATIRTLAVLLALSAASCARPAERQEVPRREIARGMLSGGVLDHTVSLQEPVDPTRLVPDDTALERVWTGPTRDDFEMFPPEIGPIHVIDRAMLLTASNGEACVRLEQRGEGTYDRETAALAPTCTNARGESAPARVLDERVTVREVWYEQQNVGLSAMQPLDPNQGPVLAVRAQGADERVWRAVARDATLCCPWEGDELLALALFNPLFGLDETAWTLRFVWRFAPTEG